ncbi:MAG: SDR family NAD(P)-dependent oxidoreductase [Bacteriovorax sp.]|jgi:short-subunit dehydrogenase
MEAVTPNKPLAVVTGASSGIGYEMAKQFAQHGYDLIIVSENPAIVEAAQTCRMLGAEVESYVIDLAEYEGVDELKNKIDETDRPVEAIAINGGINLTGESRIDADWDDELNVINLNVISTVHLAKHMINDMIKRKRGKILFTSSVVGPMPDQLGPVYSAAKSFIQTYAESLREQLKGSGITITELVPESPENNFLQPAAEVAEYGFQYMMSGEGHVEVGLAKNKSGQGKVNAPRAFGEASKLKH